MRISFARLRELFHVSILNLLPIQTQFFADCFLKSLPNDKILDWSKLKVFADNKIKVLNMMIFFPFDSVENIVVKGENAGLSKDPFNRVVKSRDCLVKS